MVRKPDGSMRLLPLGKPPRVADGINVANIPLGLTAIDGCGAHLLVGLSVQPASFRQRIVPSILRLHFCVADILPRKLTCPLKHSLEEYFPLKGPFLGDMSVFRGVVVLAKCCGTEK